MTVDQTIDGARSGLAQPRPHSVCAVTGAGGYVGSRIATHLANVGWQIRALCRSPHGIEDSRFTSMPFELGDKPAPRALDGADALVHVAYDFSHTHWSDIARVNIDGTRKLFAAAQAAAVDRIVYVSTTAAFPGARSKYGRAKLEIERIAIEVGATVIRPGLVWGPQGAAMFGALRSAVRRLPVVPLLAPADLGLTFVYEDDLAFLMERVLDEWPDASQRLFVAASRQTLTFSQLMRSISLHEGTNRYFIAFPWTLAWLALRTLERLGATPPFPSDRLLSLATADRDPLARATGHAERYGVEFRPYSLT
jgi:nucleoside-diphosphate-sugar epimerase